MKNKIIFTRSPELLRVPVDPGRTLCIYHKSYTPPVIPDCDYMSFERYKVTHTGETTLDNYSNLVFVGLNKMITPGNRIDPVWEILYNQMHRLSRFSVDTSPYIGDLWRIWFHFGAVCLPFGGYTYSYLLESHYKSYTDRVRSDNPLSIEKIREYSNGNVDIDYLHYFSEPKIEIIPMPVEIHEEYQKLKTQLFDEEINIRMIIRGLAKFAQQSCKFRRIPQVHTIFRSPDKIKIVRTDLKVDEYLISELINKIHEVNTVCEAMHI